MNLNESQVSGRPRQGPTAGILGGAELSAGGGSENSGGAGDGLRD